jgi:hypothetical protein
MAPMSLDQVHGVLLGLTAAATQVDRIVEIVDASGGTIIAELRADRTGGDG